MKTIKTIKTIKNLMIMAILLLSNWAIAQNNIWSLPPNYAKFPSGGGSPIIQSLPIPTIDQFGFPVIPNSDPWDGYDGQPAKYSHNAMQDANGDLLFFIVDGFIYDKNGLNYERSVMGNYQTMSYGVGYWGYSETMIVPDPGNCNRYYIFSVVPTGIGAAASKSNINLYAGYSILNLEIEEVPSVYPGYYHGLEPNPAGSNPALVVDALPKPAGFDYFPYAKQIQFAATDLNSNNERFIYVVESNLLLRYKLTASGLFYDGEFGDLGVNISSAIRSEMELVKLSNGNYRLALPIIREEATTPTQNNYYDEIAIFEINPLTGDYLPGSREFLIYDIDEVTYPTNTFFHNSVTIKGLEFSPNGDYLYITRTRTSQFPEAMDIYEIGSGIQPPNIPGLTLSNFNDFKLSQIELGGDGKLYFAANDRLATYSNPNTPFLNPTGQWNDNALSPISYNKFNTYDEWYTYTANDDRYTIYMLPDQIDGMDYSTIGNISVSISGANQRCIGDEPTTLTASSSVSGVTFEWIETNTPGVIIGTGASITVSPTTSTNYTVYATLNGCDGQSSIDVEVNPLPTVTALEDVTLCANDNFPVTLYSGHSKGYTYSWSTGGNVIGTLPTLQVNTPGTYCLTITTNSTGCTNFKCVTVGYDERINNTADFIITNVGCNQPDNKIYVDLTTDPLLGYVSYGATSNIKTFFSLLKQTTSGGWTFAGQQFYTWDNATFYTNGGAPNNLSFVLDEGTNYKIVRTLTFPDGCVSNIQKISGIIACLGGGRVANIPSQELTEQELRITQNINNATIEFALKPNPTSGNVTVSLSNNAGNEIIELIDYTGKVVLTEKMNAASQTLDIQHLSNGVYFVKVISGNDVKVEKLIKQ